MRAVVGDDDSLWEHMPCYFPPGTPLYTDDGGDILKGPPSFVRRLSADHASASSLMNGAMFGQIPDDGFSRLGLPARAAPHLVCYGTAPLQWQRQVVLLRGQVRWCRWLAPILPSRRGRERSS
jgi:hypothetical protein